MTKPLDIGDIVIIRFPLQNSQGREQEGIRPALIVGIPDKVAQPRFFLIIVAPMTSDKQQSWSINSPQLYPKLSAGIAKLPNDSIILLDQIRAIDIKRVVSYLGTLTKNQYQSILNSLQIMLTR